MTKAQIMLSHVFALHCEGEFVLNRAYCYTARGEGCTYTNVDETEYGHDEAQADFQTDMF